MKNIYKIFTYLLILPLFALACNQETELEYEPGTAELSNSYGVYFPVQDASGSHTYDPEMQRSVSVTVARPADKSSGAITVPYTLTASAEGIFEAGDITFADGQTETKLNVTFDKAEVGVNYSFTLVIDDPEYCYVYGNNATSFNFSVLIVTWEYILNPKTGEPSLFEVTQEAWSETCWGYVKYYEVDGVRTCFLELNGKHVYNGEEYESPDFWGPEGAPGAKLQFKIYTKDKNADGNMFVELLPLEYYYHPSYAAMIWYYDYYYYFTVYNPQDALAGMSWIDFAKNYGDSYPLGYYDDNGGLFFYVKGRYMLDIGGWTMDTYDIIGIGEGFTRVDYSLSLESDYTVDGKTPIYVEAGADVAKLKYAIYPGELTAKEAAAQVDVIDKDENAAVFTEFEFDEDEALNYATLEVAPETTGTYTLVALAYDGEDGLQNNEFVVFKHVATADSEKYAVDLSVFTEDTPARYTSYHKYDSFAYGVSGKDLTDVHVGIFKLDDVLEDQDAYFDAVKFSADYAVTSDILAQVNGEGGYYTVATSMPAKTDLIVIAWATNGSLDDWAYAVYTTDKLPYVWNSLGKGLINDGFFNYLFSNKPEVKAECDVYEEASKPGLYMVTGFQCAVVAGFFGITAEEMAPYEGGNWRNAEVVVDATDPNAVFIEAQDYGISVNSSYGFFLIEADPVGTLKDGVITWPAQKMYVGMEKTGGWYYGNSQGTFSITLPSAVPTSAPVAAPAFRGEVNEVEISGNADVYSKEVVVFERDPKPVKATVSVSYSRKEGASKNLDAPIVRDSNVRF